MLLSASFHLHDLWQTSCLHSKQHTGDVSNMTQPKQIRTRVAPSPTGFPHIGTAYIALFNYAFAKSQGGKFILRIEDTDQTRSTKASEDAILEAIRWVGIDWDEGPDNGGDFGPYRQSERTQIYRKHCEELIEKGHAYPCFCTVDRLNQLRRTQQLEKTRMGYDGLCSNLSKEEATKRMESGEPYVVRMKVPAQGDCVFQDRLRGAITIPWANIDHQVLMKSDGFPTYHLANVVDDHLMEITHVIRGEEWINSAPKHLLLYKYFGWQAPELIHLPLLRNPDKSKLSKRKNPTGILYYKNSGIMPEALLNYLALMAYCFSEETEMFSLEQMVETFNIDKVSLGGPIFDLKKLTWLNARYLRETLDAKQLYQKACQWMLNDQTWEKIMPLAQTRIEKLSDLLPMTSFIFADNVDYNPADLLTPDIDGQTAQKLLKLATWELEKATDWDKDIVQNLFTVIAEKEDIKLRTMMPLFFVAVTGKSKSIPLFDSIAIIGIEMFRRRLQYASEHLIEQGFELKGKTLKKLEKYYQQEYV